MSWRNTFVAAIEARLRQLDALVAIGGEDTPLYAAIRQQVADYESGLMLIERELGLV